MKTPEKAPGGPDYANFPAVLQGTGTLCFTYKGSRYWARDAAPVGAPGREPPEELLREAIMLVELGR